jgi:TRAP-type C4-dicarboxylate transport system substrate-binding protein
MRGLWDARERTARQTVESRGAAVNTVEKQAFIDAMRPVYARFAATPELQALVTRIQAVAG